MASDDLDTQQRLLLQATRLDELYGEAHHNLGVVQSRLGHHYAAASELQRAADLMPGNPTPYANLAVLHGELQQWSRALAFARQAYARDPDHVFTLRVLGRCLQSTRADPKQLEEVLQKLLLRDASPVWHQWATELALQSEDKRELGN